MNKLITFGTILCICQFVNISFASNENNNKIIEKQNTFDNILKAFPNIKRSNPLNNLTFSNNNCKCWFMSTFQLFVTALNQSEHGDAIRQTNFARFVNHLRNMQNDLSRGINIQQNEINSYKRKMYSEWNYLEKDKDWNIRNLTRDRTGKSNIIGGTIDLISELILWCSDDKNNKWYQEVKDKKNINNITTIEKERREKTLELLYQLQDMNPPSDNNIAVMIILNIFPELKQFLAVWVSKTNGTIDDIINSANEFILDSNTMKKKLIDAKKARISQFDKNIKEDIENNDFNNIEFYNAMKKDLQKEISNIENSSNNKYMKLSSYSDYNNYFNESNKDTAKISNITNNNIQYSYSNKPYLIFSSNGLNLNNVVTKYKITYIKGKSKLYELIGIQLDNNGHGICLVKTGKSESSWSSIDSNRDANDDGYKLSDIIYNETLGDNNNYLAKVYDDKIEKRTPKKLEKYNSTENELQKNGFFKYKPKMLLYKLVLQNNLSQNTN